MAKREEEAQTPADERAQIGTPAGESPIKGRERHKTKCLTDVCPSGSDIKPVNVVEEPEDFEETEEEIATTGGTTGTKVKGDVSGKWQSARSEGR